MLQWLKNNTIGKIERWVSRQYIRTIGEAYKERFRERVKYVPEELKKYYTVEMLMNNNATALHNLYKEAKDRNKFQEAFLYFFYEFEISLKHLIMSEMMKTNILKALEEKTNKFFLVYSQEEINSIQKIGWLSKLIKTFCLIYGEKIKIDLEGINRERNFIIHNMLKEEMSEEQIKKSFEQFFVATKSYVKNSYGFFINIFDERPKNFLTLLEGIVIQKNQNISDQDVSTGEPKN